MGIDALQVHTVNNLRLHLCRRHWRVPVRFQARLRTSAQVHPVGLGESVPRNRRHRRALQRTDLSDDPDHN